LAGALLFVNFSGSGDNTEIKIKLRQTYFDAAAVVNYVVEFQNKNNLNCSKGIWRVIINQ
jgi:hypothetical protein